MFYGNVERLIFTNENTLILRFSEKNIVPLHKILLTGKDYE